MGCGDACRIYPGKRYLDWQLDDPAGQSVEAVRPIIDEIDARVQGLLAELIPTPTCRDRTIGAEGDEVRVARAHRSACTRRGCAPARFTSRLHRPQAPCHGARRS